jgi:hypothetical protein
LPGHGQERIVARVARSHSVAHETRGYKGRMLLFCQCQPPHVSVHPCWCTTMQRTVPVPLGPAPRKGENARRMITAIDPPTIDKKDSHVDFFIAFLWFPQSIINRNYLTLFCIIISFSAVLPRIDFMVISLLPCTSMDFNKRPRMSYISTFPGNRFTVPLP